MARAKTTKPNKPLGRDAHGKPVPLQSTSSKGFAPSDPVNKAQRHGDVRRGAMGEGRKVARKKR